MPVKVLNIEVPEYVMKDEIAYDAIGKRIDNLIASNLEDGLFLERTIGMIDHPKKTIEELVELILQHGTDKYDKTRESIFDDEFSCYEFDIHASEFEIQNHKMIVHKNHNLETYYGQSIYCFHKLALIDRGYSVKIGISMIYDKAHLLPPKQVKQCDENIVRYSKYLYRFKDHKPLNALKAIIKIT